MTSVEDQDERVGTRPSPRELLDRAIALRPLLVEQAAETEERRYYSEEIHRAFEEAGLLPQPACRAATAGSSSTSPNWLRLVDRARPRRHLGGVVASRWPPGTRCRSAPSGRARAGRDLRRRRLPLPRRSRRRSATRDAHRRRLGAQRARVAYCSGAPYSTHYMGQTFMPDEPAARRPMLLFVAPRSEWTMLDDWGDLLGLQGQRLAQRPLRGRPHPRALGARGHAAWSTSTSAAARPGSRCTATRCTRARARLLPARARRGHGRRRLRRARRVRGDRCTTQATRARRSSPRRRGPRLPALVRRGARQGRDRRGGAAQRAPSSTWSSAARRRGGRPVHARGRHAAGLHRARGADARRGTRCRATSSAPPARARRATASAWSASTATCRWGTGTSRASSGTRGPAASASTAWASSRRLS